MEAPVRQAWVFLFSSRSRHTRWNCDWSSDVCSSDLADSSRRLWHERRIAFRSGPGLVEHLIASGGYQAALGARPMRQVIQRVVESPLADEILAGRVKSGETLLARAGPSGVEFVRE